MLGKAARNAPQERTTELKKQYERLSADREKRVSKIDNVDRRLLSEDNLIYAYYESGRLDKAKAMFAKSLKTADSLPKVEERRRAVAHLNRRWKETLEEE